MEYDAKVNADDMEHFNNSHNSPITSMTSSPMKFMNNSLYDYSP